jgi:hypothetical protein
VQSEADRLERDRQEFISQHAQQAKAWWESGRTYYIVKLSLGSTRSG